MMRKEKNSKNSKLRSILRKVV